MVAGLYIMQVRKINMKKNPPIVLHSNDVQWLCFSLIFNLSILIPMRRLIVVAEKQTVYDKFPIPLINRLEKHFLTVNNLLNKEQCRLERQLKDWVQHLVKNG